MQERVITFASGELTLEGVLRVPEHADGPTPCVLLIHGSMEQDRDGNMLPARHGRREVPARNFFVHIASRLCSAGYATFSYDRRGFGASDGKPGDYFTDVDDAIAALETIAAQPEADRDRIAVFGQSAGVYTSSLLAERSKLPAIYILSGGLFSEYRDMMSFNYHRARDFALRSPEHLTWAEEHDPRGLALGMQLDDMFRAIEDGREEYVIAYGGQSWAVRLDARVYAEEWAPARQFRHIDRPTLVVHGENDLNVPPRDALGIVETLRRRNVPVELAMIPDADHSFQHTPPDYETRVRERMSLASFERPYREEYFDSMIDFLGRRFGATETAGSSLPV
ncbi:MAG: alpha/beta fold hydrolase [Actinomycetota bacterium]|nr:alpha/beta fold hydrolase [Actinomycetota bacterium]